MDILQIALVFLILIVAVFLSVLGIQVFFILQDLKKSAEKIDRILDSGAHIAKDVERPIRAASNAAVAIESSASVIAEGAKLVKSVTKSAEKSSRRFFKRL